jgi:hypothetical protein
LSPRSVDGELLAGPAKEGWVSPLHRAKAHPGPCRCQQRQHLVVSNSLLRALLWCLCVPVGVPLEDQLCCLCRWSLDPLGGALALVSSGFLPLGRSVFRRPCASDVLHVLWVWSMYQFSSILIQYVRCMILKKKLTFSFVSKHLVKVILLVNLKVFCMQTSC